MKRWWASPPQVQVMLLETLAGLVKDTVISSSNLPYPLADDSAFKQILEMSNSMASTLVKLGVEVHRDTTKMVSILFPTGLDFLIIWITLMRMGYGVVLIA